MRLSSLRNNNGWSTTTCWFHRDSQRRQTSCLEWYTYRQNNKIETWISWKCTHRNCKATICTRDDTLSKIGQPHNHLPDRAAVEGRRILSIIRNRARDELAPLPSIYDEEITKLRDAPWDAQSREVASKLPTFHTVKSSLYRSRQKMLPPVPTTRPEIQLEMKFRQTTSGEPFLQAENGDINKILIFSTLENIHHLCNADRIYCDGTFYTAPHVFDSILADSPHLLGITTRLRDPEPTTI